MKTPAPVTVTGHLSWTEHTAKPTFATPAASVELPRQGRSSRCKGFGRFIRFWNCKPASSVDGSNPSRSNGMEWLTSDHFTWEGFLFVCLIGFGTIFFLALWRKGFFARYATGVEIGIGLVALTGLSTLVTLPVRRDLKNEPRLANSVEPIGFAVQISPKISEAGTRRLSKIRAEWNEPRCDRISVENDELGYRQEFTRSELLHGTRSELNPRRTGQFELQFLCDYLGPVALERNRSKHPRRQVRRDRRSWPRSLCRRSRKIRRGTTELSRPARRANYGALTLNTAKTRYGVQRQTRE